MNKDEFPQFEPPQDSGFTMNEKLGLAGLVILFIVIIYLGFGQLGAHIRTPFNAFIAKHSGGKEAGAALSGDSEAAKEELKNKDTDQDGLSDYDELYIFRTSPYLPDSDSDSLADKQEVEGGTDPNCPQGKTCQGSALTNAESAPQTTSTLGAPGGSIVSADQLLLQSIFGDNPDVKTLRGFLLKQGMDGKFLEKFSDTELLEVFKESISAASKSPSASQAVNPPTIDIDKITAPQIRELLQQQGADTEQLKKITDVDLLKVFKGVVE